jgi:hypothetical protein
LYGWSINCRYSFYIRKIHRIVAGISNEFKSRRKQAHFDKDHIIDFELQKGIGIDTESIPCSPIAPLRKIKTSGGSISIDKVLENAYYDNDLNTSGAIFDLYLKGIEINRIQRSE